MNIGKQIRTHRLKSNLTQERLAEILNVTSQAVSKWETGAGYPDITLLPELSAALGASMDELFETSFNTHLNRIEQMMENSACLSDKDFAYAEARLKEGLLDLDKRGSCLTMLAELYAHRARSCYDKAAKCAKSALEIEPENKDNHSVLCEAQRGGLVDWCVSNHTALIDYYKEFVRKNPDYRPGYMWLMDNLIADGRLDEANEALEKLRSLKDSYHYPLFKGLIAKAAGDFDAAERHWQDMVTLYPNEWLAWSARGDAYAKQSRYDEAIQNYKQAAELQEKPRLTDNYDSIAQLSIIEGDIDGAIAAYEAVVDILRNDWELKEGETIRGYIENIERLKKNR